MNIMVLFKVAPIFLLAVLAGAEKKIELQDIEEDNLKSEKQHEQEQEARSQAQDSTANRFPFDYFKNDFLQYFGKAVNQPPQQSKYVHQYAVTEAPERSAPAAPSPPQYFPIADPRSMFGYLSNYPMQVYVVPQYFDNQGQPPQPNINAGAAVARVTSFPGTTGFVQGNLVDVPGYVAATKYLPPYQQTVAYVSYGQPPVTPSQSTIAPVVAYQMPVVQYPSAIVSPPPSALHKDYYHSPTYTESNTLDAHEHEIESSKQYASQAEAPFLKGPSDSQRYSYRPLFREDARKGPAPPLPQYIPKAMRVFSRPITKNMHSPHGLMHASSFIPRPNEAYVAPIQVRPTSLLDSYVPSSVQVEYMKRGLAKDPQSAYEALSSSRAYPAVSHAPVLPRHYEGGFLPNEMYHTAAGAITFGHYKRKPKSEKVL